MKIPYLQRPPCHIALSSSGDGLALLWSSPIPVVEIWDLKTRRVGGRGKVMDPVLVWKESFLDQSEAWQVTLSEPNEGTWVTAILCTPHSTTSEACLVVATVKEGKIVDRHTIPCSSNGRLVPGDEQQLGLALESSEGLLYRGKYPNYVMWLDAHALVVGYGEDTMLPISSFPEFCPISQQVAIKLGSTAVTFLLGLSAGSKLYATTPSHAIAPLLSSAVSSFAVAGSFLTYTTSAHESFYVPLSALAELLEMPGLDMRKGGAEGALSRLTKAAEKRRIERGSRIVAAIPSAMSLVLQMPRGNLETINPRPLVLEVVKSDITQYVRPMWSIDDVLILRFTAWSIEKPFSHVESIGSISIFSWNITLTSSRRMLSVSSIRFLRWNTSPCSCPASGASSCSLLHPSTK